MCPPVSECSLRLNPTGLLEPRLFYEARSTLNHTLLKWWHTAHVKRNMAQLSDDDEIKALEATKVMAYQLSDGEIKERHAYANDRVDDIRNDMEEKFGTKKPVLRWDF